jgi:hypothetical protein
MQREVLEPMHQNQAQQAEAGARSVVNAQREALGVKDDATWNAVLQLGDRYLGDDLSRRRRSQRRAARPRRLRQLGQVQRHRVRDGQGRRPQDRAEGPERRQHGDPRGRGRAQDRRGSHQAGSARLLGG